MRAGWEEGPGIS